MDDDYDDGTLEFRFTEFGYNCYWCGENIYNNLNKKPVKINWQVIGSPNDEHIICSKCKSDY